MPSETIRNRVWRVVSPRAVGSNIISWHLAPSQFLLSKSSTESCRADYMPLPKSSPNVTVGLSTSRLLYLIFTELLLAACNWRNSHVSPSLIPVFGVLCDGSTFEFFKFQEEGNSCTFFRGCIPGDPQAFRIGLPISNPSLSPTSFLRELRIICETLFDIML